MFDLVARSRKKNGMPHRSLRRPLASYAEALQRRVMWPSLPLPMPSPGEDEPEARESELIVAVFRTVILLVALIVPRLFGATAFYTWEEITLAACAGIYNITVGLSYLYPRRYGLRRPFVVIADMLLITLWMRISQQWELFSLYYIVVIVAAMWFRVFGGVIVAILCSFFFLFLWARAAGDPSMTGEMVFSTSYALNISLLLLIGCLVGYMAEAQERERSRRLEGQLLVANYQREIDLASQLQPLLVASQWLGHDGSAARNEAALHLGAAMKSARTVGGGDYFDVVPLPGGRTALCIADVSGKSIRAQARLPLLKYSLRALAPLYLDPGELLTRLNSTLSPDLQNDLFIGLCYLIIEPGQHRLLWCNAGHIAPLLLTGASVTPLEPVSIIELETTGPPLGPFPEIAYTTHQCAWNPGDRLLLYTDGLTDALSYNGTEDGEEQVRRLVTALDANQWSDPQAVAQRLVDMANAVFDGNMSVTDQLAQKLLRSGQTSLAGALRLGSAEDDIEGSVSNHRDDVTVIAAHFASPRDPAAAGREVTG